MDEEPASSRRSLERLPDLFRHRWEIATGLRHARRDGYGRRDFAKDLAAGAVVGIVAIPLSLALAIASGVPPQHGLYTAIIAGGMTALLGGSRVQVTGPTAAFVVILTPISSQYGVAGLLLASGMAGLLLFLMGLGRMGRLIEFVPYPVTCGFTAGIAIVIATLQLRDFLGLSVAEMPESYVGKVTAMAEALPTIQWADFVIGAVSLTLLLAIPKITRRVPAPLVVLPLVTIAAVLAAKAWPALSIATINSKFAYMQDGLSFAGIPRMAPPFSLPWNWPGPGGEPLPLDYETLRALLPSAFAIAVLAAIESLLSAVIADGMTGTKHEPDAELMALGLGNMAGVFFGGFAATGAIARTATNIRYGARSPIASVTHALVVLAAVLVFAPLLGYLPMAALAALLLVVAWNMSEAKHLVYVLRIAPKSDVFVLLTCLGLTVIFDMVIAVSVGLVLASLLFIRRMVEVSSVRLVTEERVDHLTGAVNGVLTYEIAGPLFFGAAEKAMSMLHVVGGNIRTVVLDFRDVPAMDVTGLINLESAVRKLHNQHVFVVLAGVGKQPYRALRKAGWDNQDGRLLICQNFDPALPHYSEDF